MTYFKNIKSFDDLKEQFKKLARINHPDAGGDVEKMKEINCEYDALFPIWKNRHDANITADQQSTETADSTRREFYTENGWKGSNHDWNRSLKEIAVIVRKYVKEKYPTFKFSVRTSYASMCQELHVSLKEAPFDLYKTLDQLTEENINGIISKANRNQKWTLDSWYPEEAKTEIERIWKECGTPYMVYREDVSEMLKDVDAFVNSYNFSDCDGMTDYFHVDFYYFDCKPDYDFKIVEKTARIKKQTEQKKETDCIEIEDSTIGLHYDIKEDIDTRDNSKIFVVKVIEKLDRDQYITVNSNMKSIGGYYSKFKHGFIFKDDPTELLTGNTDTKEETAGQQENKQQAEQKKKQAKRQKLTYKINKQIESTQKKIDSLSGDYKTNTWKRMNEQASRDSKIEGYEKDIELLQYLIDTLENRELTPLEENLIISSFRNEIDVYYRRNEAYNKPNRGTALTPIEFPKINYNSHLDGWWNVEVPKKQKRLQKANINNTADLLKAVEEYKAIYNLINKPCNYTEKKIKQLEREYKMQQKGDINFTPSAVAEQLIQYAKIDSNTRVLEPSAGIGNIADQIKQVTTNIDVCEQMYHFSELLKLKGYNVVENDFLEYNTDQKYDAIIMNPPFSDEIRHIQHAYELLNNGGTLVSISSPHWTFANDKKSIDFRQWLENETYFTEDLKSGTFEMTGVSSKIIVIEKHEQAESKTA